MMQFVFVCAGACLGAAARHALNLYFKSAMFPVATTLVNVGGCFLIGLFWAVLSQVSAGEHLKLFLMTGFLGALTTFSAYGLDLYKFLDQNDIKLAFIYFILANGVGLVGLYLGLGLGKIIKF